MYDTIRDVEDMEIKKLDGYRTIYLSNITKKWYTEKEYEIYKYKSLLIPKKMWEI